MKNDIDKLILFCIVLSQFIWAGLIFNYHKNDLSHKKLSVVSENKKLLETPSNEVVEYSERNQIYYKGNFYINSDDVESCRVERLKHNLKYHHNHHDKSKD